MAQRFYPAVLERGARGTFVVWFPDFSEVVAGGVSQESAIEKAQTVLAHAVDALAERDHALPEPTPFDQIKLPKGSDLVAFFVIGVEPPDPAERVNIYLPRSLIARADRRAADLGMSRSSFFGLAISGTLAGAIPSSVIATTTLPPRSKARQAGKLREKKARAPRAKA
jgi:predicted RNase H-like HicB family nuclease